MGRGGFGTLAGKKPGRASKLDGGESWGPWEKKKHRSRWGCAEVDRRSNFHLIVP